MFQTTNQFKIHLLTGAKRREWMGCWGLLGLLLIVSQWIIPENSLLTSTSKIKMIKIYENQETTWKWAAGYRFEWVNLPVTWFGCGSKWGAQTGMSAENGRGGLKLWLRHIRVYLKIGYCTPNSNRFEIHVPYYNGYLWHPVFSNKPI